LLFGYRVDIFSLTTFFTRFDEVHFGKFLSFYLKREYFFDVHPPLAKLMLAAHAWLIGYKGDFAFENIADSYIGSNVPYVGLRSFSAILGSLTPMLVYAIMKESGYPAFASTISACLIVFG
jgi:dolichyl-phosphate-mannose-protein mannosyltransferase